MRSSAFDDSRPPRPHLSPEQHDSRLQRAQEIAARKQVSRCGNCGELGHWHKECPRPSRKPAAIWQFSLFPSPTEPPASPAPGVFPSPQDSRSAALSPPVMMTPPRAYMVQCQDQEVQPFDWLADSRSSHHMSDQCSWFTNFTEVPAGTWPVQAVGGHTTFVAGIGDILIEINIRNQWEC